MIIYSFQFRTINIRQFSSALYITRDKAQKNFAVLTPIIDFDEQLKQKDRLIENIKARQLPIDLNVVKERWDFFKNIENKKGILEQTKSELGPIITRLMKHPDNENFGEEINKLKLHLKVVKEDLKSLRSMSSEVEEEIVLQVLNLPNSLHKKTPLDKECEVFSYLEKIESTSESHLTIANKKGYIKYISPLHCYLKSDAALFERAMQNYFNEELLNLNYTQFSNCDFVRSVVVEGCGSNPWLDNCEVFTLENVHNFNRDDLNKLHLSGASSLYSFMAYFTKHCLESSHLPIKAFCLGRNYVTAKPCSSPSLFHLNQSSDIGIFIATLEKEDILETVLNEAIALYKQLGFHFRIVLVAANKLKRAESLRMSIEMFSNHLLSYVEVGYVSFYQDYLSKRLLFNYNDGKNRKYPYVVNGSLMNIHKVVGCLLENKYLKKEHLMNDLLSKYAV
ncbi:hypothetical protein ABEB36_005726 [Hypothenemus hampei]|uniref:Aminoacyl-tRNA synthetase class II (G/ P/ S/T) domain-containing protein n=1 Tax=Hypothenemus hampei TaxID=57062 RepID=A0ABD1EZB4_HYPHA